MPLDHETSKTQQLANGYYQSGTGPTEILVLGTCRTIAYVTYLSEWNEGDGNNQLTIRRIDPGDWTRANISIASLESDKRILRILESADIFIHEHFVNYGMFNTELAISGDGICHFGSEPNRDIYHFGMKPKHDISIPNWHGYRVLENDWADYGEIVPDDYTERGEAAIKKFCAVCGLSSFAEFGNVFRDTWRSTRYAWRPSYVAAAFTKALFWNMNSKFLRLPIKRISDFDLLGAPYRSITLVTQRDRDGYGLVWT